MSGMKMVSETASPTSPLGKTSFDPIKSFDVDYIKSPTRGIMKLSALILNILVNICIVASVFRWHARGLTMYFVSVLGAFLAICLLLSYSYHFVERTPGFPWLMFEMTCSAVLLVLYLFTSSFAVAYESALYSAAGFFGYLLMVMYGFEVFMKARALRRGETAQGDNIKHDGPTFT